MAKYWLLCLLFICSVYGMPKNEENSAQQPALRDNLDNHVRINGERKKDFAKRSLDKDSQEDEEEEDEEGGRRSDLGSGGRSEAAMAEPEAGSDSKDNMNLEVNVKVNLPEEELAKADIGVNIEVGTSDSRVPMEGGLDPNANWPSTVPARLPADEDYSNEDAHGGGFGGIGSPTFPSEENWCSEVMCDAAPWDDCIPIYSEYYCCPYWICDGNPMNCTSMSGEVYQIDDTWDEGCQHCYCDFDYGDYAAYNDCYAHCYEPPHRDCLVIPHDNNTCCDEYSCENTTCYYDWEYHAIGDEFRATFDKCQMCTCLASEDNTTTISCSNPAVCPDPPSQECRPLKLGKDCCPTDYDCTNTYLITTPKKFIKRQTASVCVIAKENRDTTNVNVNVTLSDMRTMLEYTMEEEITRDSSSCLDIAIPESISSTANLRIYGTIGSVNVSENMLIQIVDLIKTFVQTDKYLYMQGQVVKFRILTFIGTKNLVSYDDITEVWIMSPRGSRLFQWKNVSNPYGLVQLQFPLANEVEEGKYKIEVRHEGGKASEVFLVKDYVLPRFELTLQPPPYVLKTDEEIVFLACAKYTYGQPVSGILNLSVGKEYRYDYYYYYHHEESLPPVHVTETFTGCANISVNATSLGSSYNLKATGNFTEEGTNISTQATVSFAVERREVEITNINSDKYYKSGLPPVVQVKVSRPDSSSVQNEMFKFCLYDVCKNYTSNEDGIITAAIPPHLIGLNDPYIEISEIRSYEEGPMGFLYPGTFYHYMRKYYSPSYSSLSFLPSDEVLVCTSNLDTISIPVLFVANRTSSAVVHIQVIARSQVKYVNKVTVSFVSGDLLIDNSIMLRPLIELDDEDLTRGQFTIDIPVTPLMSPNLYILVWYLRADGEVVSASTSLDVAKCLLNPTSLQWTTETDPPSPKDAANLSIVSSPNSICGLGVVDKSVELMSRKQRGKLSVSSAFDLLHKVEPSTGWHSQIDDRVYCNGEDLYEYESYYDNGEYYVYDGDYDEDYGDEYGEYDYRRRKRSSLVYTPSYGYSYDFDAIKAFEDTGLYVFTDLTLETRMCQFHYYGNDYYDYDYGDYDYLPPGEAEYDYPIGVSFDANLTTSTEIFTAEIFTAMTDSAVGPGLTLPPPPPLPLEPGRPPALIPDYDSDESQESGGGGGSGDSIGDSEDYVSSSDEEVGDDTEERTYFPETWLWDIVIVSEEGEAVKEVQFPDTITEWVGEAVCVHPEHGLGLSPQASIKTFTPFFLDLSYPPTARRGEGVPVLVSVFNYFDRSLPISVELEDSSEHTASVYTKEACVDANQKEVLQFRVTPSEVGEVNLTFTATIDSSNEDCGGSTDVEKSDTVIQPLKVKFEGVTKEVVHSKYLCSGDDDFQWPVNTQNDIVDGSDRTFISASADILGPTLENLGNLIRMPSGCGEQNMLNFAPNIFIKQYLESSDQLTPDIESKLLEYTIAGYQRELKYRHNDGSFSAFGESDGSGSTWLTAFVLKSFSQAADFITIDSRDLSETLDWLLSLQDGDGCFNAVGQVLHKAMKGGVGTTGNDLIPLSSYVLISLLEANQSATDASVIMNAKSCITSQSSDSIYINALKAYALALAGGEEADDLINGVYDNLDQESAALSREIMVETLGYLLLAMLRDPDEYAAKCAEMVRRITKYRNGQGGFVSTQDTVIALQSLAEYGKTYPSSPGSLTISVEAESDESHTFSITPDNKLVLQTYFFDKEPPYNVTVSPSGTGCAVVVLAQRYNIPEETESTAFSLSVSTSRVDCDSRVSLEICTSYLLDDLESNMAIIDIDLESGYSAVEDDLNNLVRDQSIQRFELQDGEISLYLDSIGASMTCLSFANQRNFAVENSLQGTVKVYDYYQTEFTVTEKIPRPNGECNPSD